ncbi:acylglycerol kinase, mitochondrial-like [Lingula anatina]|uniref:Acylglycerol kinase, mitochondrial-like n=1 Tax=Lingula anatina TaxID=7574 RepID=A0A1S3K0M8_LINAN|nr:acylglycerol kinase, mitochondrial-like [Lingula anatina]|eukprot:XP_013416188.1 acylglycerol kinase, mitochondrial-like [Lingula anatina]
MEISIGPDNLTKTDFIKEGWRRQGENQPHRGAKSDERFKIFTSGEFTLSPELPEGQENWFSIDMEQFEAMPIKVKLKKDIINVFHRQSTTEPALSSS